MDSNNCSSKKIVLIILALAIAVMIIVAGAWYVLQPKFHDVTIELGEALPELSDFTTKFAVKNWCSIETDSSLIDLSKPGEYEITLKQLFINETVTLKIEDTTAPTVKFQDVTVHLGTEISAKDFVVSVSDLSPTTIDFANTLSGDETFGFYSVDIVVSDDSGNTVTETCGLHYIWIVPAYTLEIGKTLEMDDLLTCEERSEEILSQDWLDTVNQSPVGTYSFESKYGEYTQRCTVTVQDTLPPELNVDDLTTYLGRTVEIDDFIDSVSDASGEFELTASEIPSTDVTGTYTITFKAVDGSGNSIEKNVQMYVIEDKEPPVFSGLGTLYIELGEEPSYKNGVRAVDNQDGSIGFSIDTSSVDLETLGTYYITYYATDGAGNSSSAVRTVVVEPDTTAPKLSGLTDMTVEKHSNPDFSAGVSALDGYDGEVVFTFNTDNLDLSKAGTYFITYTAEDQSGNVATGRRKVVVNIDSEDVAALVASEAAGLSSDPEAIRDYVRNSIAYNSNWGGEYPAWYGFTTKTGNCYVHAVCFQALLKAKGIDCMIIWCENKSHYWNLVKINGEWKHMDSTPGFYAHRLYSIMNDEQRYETLSGRDWDRTAWPVCN